MNESTPGPTPLPLVDLPAGGRSGSLALTTGGRRVASRLSAGGPAVLWVDGSSGAGKTTAILSAVLPLESYRLRQRLACAPGTRLEELLYLVSHALRHLGIDEVTGVLDQRCRLDAKLGRLLEAVLRHPILLWWDDVHHLEPGPGESELSESFRAWLERCGALPADARGRIVFSSRAPCPSDGIATESLGPLDASGAKAVWELWCRRQGIEGRAPPADEICPDLRATPFDLRLAAGCLSLDSRARAAITSGPPGAEDGADGNVRAGAPPARDRSTSGPTARERLLALLPEPSRRWLEGLATFRGPLSRRALDALARGLGCERPAPAGEPDSPFEPLLCCGLVERSGAGSEPPRFLEVHAAVRESAEADLRRREPGLWRRLMRHAAEYHLQVAVKSTSTWSYLRAHDFLFEAGDHEEACQVHKAVLESLLRCGYLDLARRLLSRTIETTEGIARTVALGNLAIIHKNEGDHPRALELYRRARRELESLGDEPNLARVLHQMGNTLYLAGELETALARYRESRKISVRLGERAVATATLVQIANVLHALGQSEEALGQYEVALEEIDASGRLAMAAAVRLQVGHVHLRERRWIEADAAFARAEEASLRGADSRCQLKVARSRAMVAQGQRQYARAAEHYERAEDLATRLGDIAESIHCRLLRGEVHREAGQLGDALSCFRSARAATDLARQRRLLPERSLEAVEAAVSERLDGLAGIMGEKAFRRASANRDLPPPG